MTKRGLVPVVFVWPLNGRWKPNIQASPEQEALCKKLEERRLREAFFEKMAQDYDHWLQVKLDEEASGEED